MAATATSAPWLICTDTGGTFTDCLARDPMGGLHRAKVLSTSALRGRVARAIDAHRFEVEQQWGACDDFIQGFTLRLLQSGEVIGTVARFDAAKSIVHVDKAVRIGDGMLVEAKGDEPAPVLAARLVTRTPAGRPLPQMHL